MLLKKNEFRGMKFPNTDDPTHVRGGRLDLTFAPVDFCCCNFMAAFTNVTILMPQKLAAPPPPEWAFRSADWVLSRNTFQSWYVGNVDVQGNVEDQHNKLTIAL